MSAAVTDTPAALHALTATQRAPLVHAYAQSLDRVYLWAVPVAAIGFVVALVLKEVPLRGTSQASANDIGDGFAMPTQESSQQRLERAIAGVIRSRGREELPEVLAQTGTPLSAAGAWGVVEVARYTQALHRADIREMARHHQLPAAVLEPTFVELAGQGMVTRTADQLALTDRGEQEIDRVVGSFRHWLTEQLADWDTDPAHPLEPQIGAALSDISRRMLQHAEHRPPALTAVAGAPENGSPP